MLLVGAAVVSALILVAWFPASALYRQHASLAGASQQLRALHQQDSALAQERKNLSDSSEIARIAREQYQLVSPGQHAYEVLPPSGAAVAGAPYAGDPALTTPADPSDASELPPGTTGGHTASTAHHPASSDGAFQRMLRALEFWR
jgi:cell division protein FtsB